MEHVDFETAQRRAELIMQLQSEIMEEFCRSQVGKTLRVLCEGYDEEQKMFFGRSYADSPDIDGLVFFDGAGCEGNIVDVKITAITDECFLVGEEV